MKPIKLTMSAFGPYAGKQELDMTRLGETGLYAITGETEREKRQSLTRLCLRCMAREAVWIESEGTCVRIMRTRIRRLLWNWYSDAGERYIPSAAVRRKCCARIKILPIPK